MKRAFFGLLLGLLFAAGASAQAKDHYGYLYVGTGRAQGHATFQAGYGMNIHVGARFAVTLDEGYLRARGAGFFTSVAGAAYRVGSFRRVVPFAQVGYSYFIWTGSSLYYPQGFSEGYYGAGALYQPRRGTFGIFTDFRRYDRPGGPAFNQVRAGVLFRFGGEHR